MATSTAPTQAAVEDALEGLRSIVSGDGVGLRLAAWDGTTAEVEIDLSGVDCLDCVLPPAALRDVIGDFVRNQAGEVAVVVHDPRAARRAVTETVLVLDPTGQPPAGNEDPGPDAGPLAGRRVAMRVDVLWRSWDWVADEWASALRAAGAEVDSFRHTQGAAGEEGAAHHADYVRFVDGSDLAVVGLGNCGSCTSWTVKDALVALEAGKPTLAVVTEQFETLARTLARQYGRPGLRLLVLPYPLDTRPEDEVREIARQRFDEALAALGATA